MKWLVVRGLWFVMWLMPLGLFGRTVATGTIVANPGATVSVPVTIDDLSDVAAAVVTVNYDSTVLVCLGVDAGGVVNGAEGFAGAQAGEDAGGEEGADGTEPPNGNMLDLGARGGHGRN